MNRLVLIRHGESTWNKENRFTGWTDVELSERGLKEAREAGQTLKKEGFNFKIAYTSYLTRAIRTLWLVLDEMDLMYLPTSVDWRLNERHYGALQGLNKKETADQYGLEQVKIWRRSYDTPPPALEVADPRHPSHDPRYAGLGGNILPRCESLKDTLARVMPWWNGVLVPALRAGRKPLVVAHGNSIRAIVKHLDGISEQDIVELNIPTGIPLLYELDDDLKVKSSRYLGSAEDAAKAAAAVAAQAGGTGKPS